MRTSTILQTISMHQNHHAIEVREGEKSETYPSPVCDSPTACGASPPDPSRSDMPQDTEEMCAHTRH